MPATANGRDLDPRDPYDARIIAAYNCNNTAKAAGYSQSSINRCAAIYDGTVKFQREATTATPKQRNALAISRGLSMMTVAGGYAVKDGKMTARVCTAVTALRQSLAGYSAGASPGLEGLHTMLNEVLADSVPKCRQGGHM